MYDRKKKGWISDCGNEELRRWAAMNPNQPESRFLRGSQLLTDLSDGSDVAEAVSLMVSAAEQGYPKAMFALGQMYQYGWGVHKDRKTARIWYQKAAKNGSSEAKKLLHDQKRRRIKMLIGLAAAIAACALLAAGIFFAISRMDGKLTIRVNRDTKLVQTTTLDEFTGQLQGLIKDYDGELTVSGQVSTNRLLLRFDGEYLDLRKFPAAKVISRADNYIIIQFSTEEEAQKCLRWLQELDGIAFVQMDTYQQKETAGETDGSNLPVVTDIYPHDGCTSWGTLDLGLNQLSQYVGQVYPDRKTVVGVVDGGVFPQIYENHRFLGCVNVMDGNSQAYPDEHGTHVAGIVLDGTRGTNTLLMSFDVYGSMGGTVDSIMALAIDSAVAADVDVITMSMRWDGHSPVLEDAALNAVAQGIVFCKSAGNMAGDCTTGISCPAEKEELFVVGAYDIDHQAADFTNYGATVDVCAPGVDIFSAYYEDPTKVISLSGTSMAAPHMAAMAALLLTINPDATPAQIEQYIEDSCRTNRNPKLYATGLYGAGAPDATAFIEYLP